LSDWWFLANQDVTTRVTGAITNYLTATIAALKFFLPGLRPASGPNALTVDQIAAAAATASSTTIQRWFRFWIFGEEHVTVDLNNIAMEYDGTVLPPLRTVVPPPVTVDPPPFAFNRMRTHARRH